MERILREALKVADEAEVYHVAEESGSIAYRNSILTESSTSIHSGYSLRIIRDGILGSAYTKSLDDIEALVKDALSSLKGGVEAGFSFPDTTPSRQIDSFDSSIESMSPSELQTRCSDAIEYLGGKVDGQIDSGASYGASTLRILNSSGLDVASRFSTMAVACSILFPNTETAVSEYFVFRGPSSVPRKSLDGMADLYQSGLPLADVDSGRMKVLLLPRAMFGVIWRLNAATSGRSFHNKTSPLLDRRGEKVVSEKITYYGDPLDEQSVAPRPFDDEGVCTRRLTLFDKGVFENIYVNLDYAHRLGIEPTGNGFRGGMWGGDTITMQPSPSLYNSRFEPGGSSFADMLEEMDRGVIVLDALGAHSGNIVNGDLSIGMNPGLYVENGEIVGRVRDGMMAANIYDMLGNVVAVEDRIHEPRSFFRYPSILVDDVSVSAKKK